MAKVLNVIRKLCLIALILSFKGACAQTSAPTQVNVKTNIIYDALANANLGAEIVVAPRWSVDLSGNLNLWTINNRKWKHWLLQPEVRYWLCEATGGHFFGFHLLGGQYNFANWKHGFMLLGSDLRKLEQYRYQGWGAGAGIAYGYSWLLNRHWGIEAEVGFGWVYTRYDVFPCSGCGRKMASDQHHNYVGPTKAALNLVYTF